MTSKHDEPRLSAEDERLVRAVDALYRPPELRMHIQRGLENGLTRAEIGEVIMHMAIYGGFPSAVEAMATAREVFDKAK